MRLGGGGMATVYLARSVAGGGFERLVALKVLHPHLLAEPEFLVMFLDEARVAAKIHPPNVIAIHDLGTQDAWMYMVMDYVLGDTLAAAQKVAMKLGRGMPLEIVLRIALDALRGLDAASRACPRPSTRSFGARCRPTPRTAGAPRGSSPTRSRGSSATTSRRTASWATS